MDSLRRHVVLAPVALAGLSACARKPTPDLPRLPIGRIGVIPVAPADRLYTENKGIPIGVLWQGIADRIKSDDFSARMDAARLRMAQQLTTALVKGLNGQGFSAQVMEGIVRPQASPDDIDYRRLPGTDPVLHVYFTQVGMYSARFSPDYVPRVNVKAYLFRPPLEEYFYSESIYYGADARGDASWSVPSAARYKWPNFDALVQQSTEVEDSYIAAVNALAERIASNIRAQAS